MLLCILLVFPVDVELDHSSWALYLSIVTKKMSTMLGIGNHLIVLNTSVNILLCFTQIVVGISNQSFDFHF